jgi:hypothetical protein
MNTNRKRKPAQPCLISLDYPCLFLCDFTCTGILQSCFYRYFTKLFLPISKQIQQIKRTRSPTIKLQSKVNSDCYQNNSHLKVSRLTIYPSCMVDSKHKDAKFSLLTSSFSNRRYIYWSTWWRKQATNILIN